MSVIVKGMEMPLNCAMCERWSICECLKEYKDYESILYAVDDGDLVRAVECPLIEIPTPHGRLIDADELINDCEKLMRMLDPESKEYLRVFAIKSYLMWAAEYAVIEAEGENT